MNDYEFAELVKHNKKCEHEQCPYFKKVKELEKENKTLEGCLLAEQEHTQMLEKEKCELLGIIQEKDKVIEKMKCCLNCNFWKDKKYNVCREIKKLGKTCCAFWKLKE